MSTNPDTGDSVKPDEWDDMTEAEREAWAEDKKASLDAAADEAGTLSDEEQAALDALSDPIESDTATVELRNGVTVEVKTYLSAAIEDNLAEIDRNRDDLDAIRGTIAETMAWVIEDDEYGSEGVWRTYAENFGVVSLSELFFRVLEPALDRMDDAEVTQKFRPD